jgi:UDP-glucose 4-epimerase
MTKKLILVTGGAGHVGSHLVELLVCDPANRVISLDNYFNGSEENHVPAQNTGAATPEILKHWSLKPRM